MIRALAFVLGVATVVAASLGAFDVMRAVGPDDQTGLVATAGGAAAPERAGSLLESRGFARVVAAVRRELGPGAAVQSLDLRADGATVLARAGGRLRYVEVDASGRSQSRDAGAPALVALVPLARINGRAIDRIARAARRENDGPVEHLVLAGPTREWTVQMARGEPDQFVSNLDGSGLRLPGEPNPAPVGASPDSLLRARNLARVLAAARAQASPSARVTALDVRPDRVSLELRNAPTRVLSLSYGYEAQLTGRDIHAGSADAPSVRLGALDAAAVERMARSARRAVHAHGLADVQYVLLQARGILSRRPESLLYLPSGRNPGYVVADLRGRGLTWPGRG